MTTTPTAPKPKRTRNPASTITVGKAFDVIRARQATLGARKLEHVASFDNAEKAWLDIQMTRVPQEARTQLKSMLNAAAHDDEHDDT